MDLGGERAAAAADFSSLTRGDKFAKRTDTNVTRENSGGGEERSFQAERSEGETTGVAGRRGRGEGEQEEGSRRRRRKSRTENDTLTRLEEIVFLCRDSHSPRTPDGPSGRK